MSDEKSRLLAEAAARLPSGLHAHLEKIAGPLSVELDEQRRGAMAEPEAVRGHAPGRHRHRAE